ncbi:MAG: hypothetical protein V4534_06560 [Myxococcota bacterium]
MKFLKMFLLIALAALLGYFFFADKNIAWESLKAKFLKTTDKVEETVKQPIIPEAQEDYSHQDRERLDSILDEANH